MARLAVPQMDPKLCALLQPIIKDNRLDNDALWRSEINPLLCKFLESIGHSVRQSATINAHAPKKQVFDDIYCTLAKIQRALTRQFSDVAPFTVHRVAELLLAYRDSGYSLTTVYSAQKWLTALLRAFSVSSSESSYKLTMSSAGSASPVNGSATASEKRPCLTEEDYKHHNLPANIRFERIAWSTKQSMESSKAVDSDEPAAKKAKTSTGEEAEKSKIPNKISNREENESSSDAKTHEDASLVREKALTSTHLGEKNDISDGLIGESKIESNYSANSGLKNEKSCDISRSESRPLVISTLLIDESVDEAGSNGARQALFDAGTIDQDDQNYKEEILT